MGAHCREEKWAPLCFRRLSGRAEPPALALLVSDFYCDVLHFHESVELSSSRYEINFLNDPLELRWRAVRNQVTRAPAGDP